MIGVMRQLATSTPNLAAADHSSGNAPQVSQGRKTRPISPREKSWLVGLLHIATEIPRAEPGQNGDRACAVGASALMSCCRELVRI